MTSSRRSVIGGVFVPTCVILGVLSVEVAPRARANAPTVPALLATTSVPGVSDLERGLSATLESAAQVDDVPGNLRPSLPDARLSVSEIYTNGCHVPIPGVEPVICEYGDADGDITAVLVGDSHAGHWLPALDLLADQAGIRLLPMTKSGCSVADVAIFSPLLDRGYTECAEWRSRMIAVIAELQPDIVITSQASSYTVADLPSAAWPHAIEAGYEATLDRLAEHADQLIVLGDTPYAARDVPNCLWENLRHATTCVRSRADSFARRLTEVERAVAARAGARYLQPDDFFCGPTSCPVIVGDILVYRDVTHITTVYMTWIAPELGASLGAPWTAGTLSSRGSSG